MFNVDDSSFLLSFSGERIGYSFIYSTHCSYTRSCPPSLLAHSFLAPKLVSLTNSLWHAERLCVTHHEGGGWGGGGRHFCPTNETAQEGIIHRLGLTIVSAFCVEARSVRVLRASGLAGFLIEHNPIVWRIEGTRCAKMPVCIGQDIRCTTEY